MEKWKKELTIFIETQLRNKAAEGNNSKTRLVLYNIVNKKCKNLSSKGLMEDYEVVINETNNTKEVINNNEMYLHIVFTQMTDETGHKRLLDFKASNVGI